VTLLRKRGGKAQTAVILSIIWGMTAATGEEQREDGGNGGGRGELPLLLFQFWIEPKRYQF
jgi:hypothetical protein